VQVNPIKPKFKPPGNKRLKLKCDTLLSTSAFKFNLRRYSKAALGRARRARWPLWAGNWWGGRTVRLTVSKPVLKARLA